MTAASKTAGWAIIVPSRSTELIHSPPDLMTSFDAVADRHEALRVEGADVAGAQPTVVEPFGVVHAEVGAGDPRPADLELTDRLAVARQHGAVVVGDAHLDAGDDATAFTR